MYHPFFYAFEHRDKVRIRIFYFTLEMSAEQKYRQFICHLLYVLSKGKIRIDPKSLRSTNEEKPIPQDILDLLMTEKYIEYFKFFEECVTFIDSIRNPTGIFSFCRDYARQNGIQHTKIVKFKTKEGEFEQEVDDYYEQADPNEYRFVIVDHYKLLTEEKDGNVKLDIMRTIGKWSSDYAIKLRNKYNYIVCGVQQQAPGQESNENAKMDKLRPTLDGLGENKSTQQDADIIFGLYGPHRHGIREYNKYDIPRFGDHIRFLEILGGREGGGGYVCPLYFDGAVNYFRELPLPDNKDELKFVYSIIENIYKREAIVMMNFKKERIDGKDLRYFRSKWRR